MNKLLVVCTCLLLSLPIMAQQKPTELDKSPMDMSYWPDNYPLLKMNGKVKDLPIARIIYSRPQKNNRIIFNGIVKYGEMWRLGANEATEVEFFKNVKIGGKLVPKGRYTLYCIPEADKWTLILNKDNYTWGNYTYDIKKDVLRTTIPVEKLTSPIENFTIYFEDAKGGNANLIIEWDDVKATMPISIVP